MSDNKIYEPNKEYPLDLTVSWDELRELYSKDEYQIDTNRDAMLQHLYKPLSCIVIERSERSKAYQRKMDNSH